MLLFEVIMLAVRQFMIVKNLKYILNYLFL